MADYDVGALALTVPPAKAVITSYRPAVSVRNNGIHEALAAGTLRIYSAGLLIFTTEIYSPTIPPGETKAATATDYWTPPSVGTYQVIAYVSCPLDQYEPNNSLPPTLVTVSAEPPPPAPTVALHASQHEEGGTDELSIDGLGGRAKDPQVPFDHVANHETGGSDVLDVTGLHGQLADGQPAAIHGNEKHAPPFATYANISEVVNAHDAFATVHAASTNLEHTANKDQTNGYCGLDSNILVPPARLAPTEAAPPDSFLRIDQTWGLPPAPAHAPTHESAGSDEISVAGLHGQLGDLQPVAVHAATHETAGPDEISVTGLHGQLGDLQPVAAHHDSHATGGSDELSVSGLKGVLYDPQTPSNHSSVDHDTSVEATAHKGAASGYAPLDAGSKVPVANLPDMPPTAHATTHVDGGTDEISIAGLSGKAADGQTPLNHGATHGNEGGDDISIGGLSGMPAAAGVALGLATLDISGKLTATQAPPPAQHGNEAHDPDFQPVSEKGAANGYAPLDGTTKVPLINLPTGLTSAVSIHDSIAAKTILGPGIHDLMPWVTIDQLADGDQVVWTLNGKITNAIAEQGQIQLEILQTSEGSPNYFFAWVSRLVDYGPLAFSYECRISFADAGGGYAHAISTGRFKLQSQLESVLTDDDYSPFVFNYAITHCLHIVIDHDLSVQINNAQIRIEKLAT